MNSQEKAAIEGYLKGSPVPNPLQHWFLEKMSYVGMRIGCSQITPPLNGGLPLDVTFSSVWELIQQHPLFLPYIELNGGASEASR